MPLNVLRLPVLFSLCLLLQNAAAQECRSRNSINFNRNHFNVRLNGYVIQNMTVPAAANCARECFRLTPCLSFNMATSFRLCQLNSVNSSTNLIPNVVADNRFNYFDLSVFPDTISGSCGKKPCLMHQICLPTNGKHTCANVECPPYTAPTNGQVTPTTAVIAGRNVTVSCRAGFRFLGDSLLTCQFDGHWRGVAPKCKRARDCSDVLKLGIGSSSGIYTVYHKTPHDVYCDMITDGGGWTVFQYRHDGSVDFYRTFAEYENGFGDLVGEFWMGLKYIHKMTNKKTSEIYLQFVDSNGNIAMERFSNFNISAGANYTLHVGALLHQNDTTSNYSLSYNNGARFAAKDFDQDTWYDNCAGLKHSGWWHRVCTYINPNGEYVTPGQISQNGGEGGMFNYGWTLHASLKSTKLMFRRM